MPVKVFPILLCLECGSSTGHFGNHKALSALDRLASSLRPNSSKEIHREGRGR